LVCLAFDTFVLLAWDALLSDLDAPTQVHDVVSANGAVVYNNVPGPKGNGIPL
jgi:N-acetyl-beta-hexosaminidase